jgi:hypothetical protein
MGEHMGDIGPLLRGLHGITSRVSALGKSGKMQGGGASYTYTSIGDAVEAIHAALVSEGIVLVPVARSCVHAEHWETKSGTRQLRCDLSVTWRLWHKDAPDASLDVVAYGCGIDSGDKAPQKAATSARKYLYIELLHLVGDADPDATGSHDQEGRGRGRKRADPKPDPTVEPVDAIPPRGTKELAWDQFVTCAIPPRGTKERVVHELALAGLSWDQFVGWLLLKEKAEPEGEEALDKAGAYIHTHYAKIRADLAAADAQEKA